MALNASQGSDSAAMRSRQSAKSSADACSGYLNASIERQVWWTGGSLARVEAIPPEAVVSTAGWFHMAAVRKDRDNSEHNPGAWRNLDVSQRQSKRPRPVVRSRVCRYGPAPAAYEKAPKERPQRPKKIVSSGVPREPASTMGEGEVASAPAGVAPASTRLSDVFGLGSSGEAQRVLEAATNAADARQSGVSFRGRRFSLPVVAMSTLDSPGRRGRSVDATGESISTALAPLPEMPHLSRIPSESDPQQQQQQQQQQSELCDSGTSSLVLGPSDSTGAAPTGASPDRDSKVTGERRMSRMSRMNDRMRQSRVGQATKSPRKRSGKAEGSKEDNGEERGLGSFDEERGDRLESFDEDG